MIKLKNNKFVNYSKHELEQKKLCNQEFLQYLNSLNINFIQLKNDKEKIQKFVDMNILKNKSLIVQINNYVYFVLIGINNKIGIITQVENKNNLNLKNKFNYFENKDFIEHLLPNFKKQYYWNYYFNEYKICGSIKKNIFKFNKGTNIYELI